MINLKHETPKINFILFLRTLNVVIVVLKIFSCVMRC